MNIAVRRDYLLRMENRALAVWIYEANIWRLIAVQSSAIAPSADITPVWNSDDEDEGDPSSYGNSRKQRPSAFTDDNNLTNKLHRGCSHLAPIR